MKPDQKDDPFIEIVATVGMYLCGVALIGIVVGFVWSVGKWLAKVFA